MPERSAKSIFCQLVGRSTSSTSGASLAGAAYLRGVDVDIESAIDATVEFVVGGVAGAGQAASEF